AFLLGLTFGTAAGASAGLSGIGEAAAGICSRFCSMGAGVSMGGCVRASTVSSDFDGAQPQKPHRLIASKTLTRLVVMLPPNQRACGRQFRLPIWKPWKTLKTQVCRSSPVANRSINFMETRQRCYSPIDWRQRYDNSQ